jgi:hypothetical protein
LYFDWHLTYYTSEQFVAVDSLCTLFAQYNGRTTWTPPDSKQPNKEKEGASVCELSAVFVYGKLSTTEAL